MSFWSEELISLLRQRAAEGASPRQVAAELGATRSAVIGKASRIGGVRWAGAPRPPRPAKVRSPTPVSVWVTLADLNADACHFPCGTPKTADFRYCGAMATNGRYCAHHHALTHYGRGHEEAKRLAEAAA